MAIAKKNRGTSPLDLVTSEIVGPSSSHTAGVMRIGRSAREKAGAFQEVKITLYNSLADTGDAHMTRSALVAGLLGWKDNDPRIPFSFRYAEDEHLHMVWANKRDESVHPNTVVLEITDRKKKTSTFRGTSIGGGRFKLARVPLNHGGSS